MVKYKEYIQSPEWEARKALFRKTRYFRAGECWVCGNSSIESHIHHINYRRLGNERMTNLRLLCAVCHAGVQEEKAQWNAVMSMVPVKHT